MSMRTNLRSSKQITLIPIFINLKKTEFGYKIYETEATAISTQLNTQTLAKSTIKSIRKIPIFINYLIKSEAKQAIKSPH